MDNTKDTPMDYKQCECGGDIIMFTPDLDICKKCGKQYEPRSALDLLKENQSLKLELQKQKELNAELVKVSNNNKCELLDRYTEFLQKEGYIDTDATMEHPTAIDIFLKKDRANESLIKKSSEI